MGKRLSALAAVGIGLISPTNVGSAAPVYGAGILRSLSETSPVQKARTFCYNTNNGRFLHWGACTYVPRVYCKNRYTGQFLYWGACRHY